MSYAKKLQSRIENKKAVVAVIGLGYVGLPLAVAYSRAGFRVIGIDISQERVKKAAAGKSYIDDISNAELKEVSSRFTATTRFESLKKADAVIICVPTPLSKTNQPDLSYIFSAVEQAVRYLKRGHMIVLESTTYPGTTEEHLLPLFQKTGLAVEKDFFLGFSPERVDPANKNFKIPDIPKVVGGIGPASSKLIEKLYRNVFNEIYPVSSAKTAEMVKLLENTFRSVNIGLINEMAMVCETLGIDIWEVIGAAKTKPFGFMPFYPGPGIGGHCINIDPMYLAWKARLHGYEPRLIELAQAINDQMPNRVVRRAAEILNGRRKPLRGSNVLIMGMSYKKNVQDTRESPSLFIMKHLWAEGAHVAFHDPYVPVIKLEGKTVRSTPLSKALLARQDLVLILTDHDGVDYAPILKSQVPIFDTRNALQGRKGAKGQIVRL